MFLYVINLTYSYVLSRTNITICECIPASHLDNIKDINNIMKIRATSQVKHKYLYPCKVPKKNHCYHSKKTTIPQLMWNVVDQDHAHY